MSGEILDPAADAQLLSLAASRAFGGRREERFGEDSRPLAPRELSELLFARQPEIAYCYPDMERPGWTAWTAIYREPQGYCRFATSESLEALRALCRPL